MESATARTLRTLFGGALLLSLLALRAAASESLVAEDTAWTVQLVGIDDCPECPSTKAFRFRSVDKGSGEASTFTIRNLMRRATQIEIYADRCVIIGELTQSGDIAVVVDLRQHQATDEMYGYHFTPSPDRRYLAFLRFYPRFTPPELVSDVVVLYDVGGMPAANRVGGASGVPQENVGLPVFPKYNVERRVLQPESGAERFLVVQPMLWMDDTLRFYVRARSGKAAMTVLADVSAGPARLRVGTRKLGGEPTPLAGEAGDVKTLLHALRPDGPFTERFGAGWKSSRRPSKRGAATSGGAQ